MSEYIIPPIENDFSTDVETIARIIEIWAHAAPDASLDINQFKDCVYIKLPSRVIAYSNTAYHDFFSGGERVNGSIGDGYLDQVTLGISVKSDELLTSSGKTVEFDHVSIGPDGNSYQLKTHKRWITPNRRNMSIFGVSRVIAKIDRKQNPTAEKLVNIAKKYESLDVDDRALCCLMAAGHSQREMAEMLGCTTRTIENRRNRIMEELGASKPIEIVKLMVRLAEHGLIAADF